MLKTSCLFLCLAVFSGAACAEQTDSCGGLQDAALTQCRSSQQALRQQQMEQQLRQQEERQNQLDKQQRDVQQQLEGLRHQNDILRKQLEREATIRTAPPETSDSKNSELKSWKAENPWFGSDYAKTQYAVHYITQLQHERPDLSGRELLDTLSKRVNDKFGEKQ